MVYMKLVLEIYFMNPNLLTLGNPNTAIKVTRSYTQYHQERKPTLWYKGQIWWCIRHTLYHCKLNFLWHEATNMVVILYYTYSELCRRLLDVMPTKEDNLRQSRRDEVSNDGLCYHNSHHYTYIYRIMPNKRNLGSQNWNFLFGIYAINPVTSILS